MRRLRAIGVAAALYLICGCGGSLPSAPQPPSTPTPTPTPTPVPTPTPAEPVLVAEGTYSPNPWVAYRHIFAIPSAGEVTVQLSWMSADNRLFVGLATDSCTWDAYHSNACTWLAQDDSARATATKTLVAPASTPGSYVLIVSNWGPGSETFSYRVTLRPSS